MNQYLDYDFSQDYKVSSCNWSYWCHHMIRIFKKEWHNYEAYGGHVVKTVRY